MKTIRDAIGSFMITRLSMERFTADLQRNISSYYDGKIDDYQLIDALLGILNRAYERAWREGAAECGIQPDERTAEEEARRVDEINRHIPYIDKLARDIIDSRRRYEAALEIGEEPYRSDSRDHYVDVRGDLWANRYNEVRNISRTMACANRKLKWVLGPTQNHCPDCLRLAGKVKRGNHWMLHPEIRPQSDRLNCQGFRCKCQLQPTDEPTSRGPLPYLVGPTR